MLNAAIVWTFAGVIAAASFARALSVRAESHFSELLWYSIGSLAMLGGALIWLSLEPIVRGQHKLILAILGAVSGISIALLAGEWIAPSTKEEKIVSDTRNPPAAMPAPPPAPTVQNVTSHNQSGGITAGTVILTPQRLQFSNALGNDLLQKMPVRKNVILEGIGGAADQQVAVQFHEFLLANGYSVSRSQIGGRSPPPDHRISLRDTPDAYILTVAPSVAE